MSCKTIILKKICLLSVICVVLSTPAAFAQETQPVNIGSNTTYHNQLFFNRFLINPTFSLVRENKSYLNILHRNQYATFEDNSQNYFLGFSNKLNENTAVGIGVYSQWSGVIQEFGFNANYAHAVKLSDKSKLTFGTNVTYFNEGLDQNRVIATSEDPTLLRSQKESKVAIQPGVTLSVGRFDFGIYAEDLLKYNQTTNNFTTNLNAKSVKASLQYTHSFNAKYGLFADARLMPLMQLGQNEDNSLSYIGALLLDLPKIGWLQSTMDSEYGMSVGLGFNLSKKMSLGYLMEKDILDKDADFGWNHELSLAYTFKNDDAVMGYADISTDAKIDQIIRNYEEQILQLKAQNNKAVASNNSNTLIDDIAEDYAAHVASLSSDNQTTSEKKKVNRNTKSSKKTNRRTLKNNDTDEMNSENSLAYQNSLILDELILRQDSIDKARNTEFEKRFETIVRFLRRDIERTIQDNLQDNRVPKTLLASNDTPSEKVVFNGQVHRNYAKVDRNTKKANVKTKKINYVINNDKSKTAQKLKTDQKQDKTKTDDNSVVAKHKDYVKLPIKVLNRSDIAGVEPGYYLIANVYKNKRYLKAFVNDLTKQGLNAKQFYNRENGLYYVYLADFKMKADAKTAVFSNLSGKYRDEKWIMQVSDHVATAEIHFDDL